MRALWLVVVVFSLSGCPAATGGPVVGDRDSGSTMDAGTITPEVDAGPREEICDNGADDDGDGLSDEGCECTEGERQPCWPGTATRRGVGSCRDGAQVCIANGEFLAWSDCTGAVLPTAEIENNGIDEDCDGGDAGGRTCLTSEFGEACAGGDDDDCDGLVDCDDPDCAGSGCSSSCLAEESGVHCTDGIDNDCDGTVDCLDANCGGHPTCAPPPPPPPGCTREFPFFAEIRCGDGRDNDCDGDIDCADDDCTQPGQCGCASREDTCGDGLDEDCDDDVDCADIDCQECTPGTTRWCDDPMYCHWGQQDCGADGRWGTCVEVPTAPGDCTGRTYSATCCVDAGECCQNYPTDDTSIGDCSGIVMCR
jgi:hypothetical protein